jgi:uncharacterized protein YoxC
MSSAAEILVIIISVVLSIFLIVGIILGIYLIRLSAEIRRIAKSAQHTVDSVGQAVEGIVKFTSPLLLARQLGQILKKFNKKSRKGE